MKCFCFACFFIFLSERDSLRRMQILVLHRVVAALCVCLIVVDIASFFLAIDVILGDVLVIDFVLVVFVVFLIVVVVIFFELLVACLVSLIRLGKTSFTLAIEQIIFPLFNKIKLQCNSLITSINQKMSSTQTQTWALFDANGDCGLARTRPSRRWAPLRRGWGPQVPLWTTNGCCDWRQSGRWACSCGWSCSAVRTDRSPRRWGIVQPLIE